jgi:thaumarchaeosortase
MQLTLFRALTKQLQQFVKSYNKTERKSYALLHEKIIQTKKYITGAIRKYAFHIVLLTLFTLPIILLMIFDYFNIESFPLSPLGDSFNQKFVFEETWKGRMFYLFFLWLLFTEFIIDREKIAGKQPKNRIRLLAFFVCAIFPTIYVLSVNLFGGGYSIVILGRNVGVASGFEYFHWPLSVEYLMFTIFFLVAVIFAYGKIGLKTLSISLSLIAGITTFYMIDTVYPLGILKPIQLLSLPAAGVTAAFCEALGYKTQLYYPMTAPGMGNFPRIVIATSTKRSYADIGWPCAGVHSMFLFILIILVFFKKSDISNFRKSVYFVVGALGTFMVNILRIYSYLVIALDDPIAANAFHDSYGELYFFSWMMVYILVIVCIQRFLLVEKIRHAANKIGSRLHL